MSEDRCAVFVSSSDNTYDVFKPISDSVRNAFLGGPVDRLYVGLNSSRPIKDYMVSTVPETGWRSELLEHINRLNDETDAIILVLDDFFFTDNVDSKGLTRCIKMFFDNELDYLRLIPLPRSYLFAFFRNIIAKIHGQSYEKIDRTEFYYSSLQVSIWRREHLVRTLKLCKDIWEFEKIYIEESRHYAVTEAVCHYRHLVEKGRWLPIARRLLGKKHPNEAHREFDKRLLMRYPWVSEIIFGVFGFSWMRLKKWFGVA